MYEAKADNSIGMSTYNVAVADLLNAPDIEEINLSGYAGNPGDIIKITATDDFGVVAVNLKIENSDGTLVEQGAAVNNGAEWIYTATTLNPDLTGDKITVTASDAPANLTEESKIV